MLKTAALQHSKGDRAGEIKTYEDVLSISRRMAATDHATTFAQNALIISLTELATLGAPDVHWSDVVLQWEAMAKIGMLLTAEDRKNLEIAREFSAKEGAR
jgi:hypothetical protein